MTDEQFTKFLARALALIVMIPFILIGAIAALLQAGYFVAKSILDDLAEFLK